MRGKSDRQAVVYHTFNVGDMIEADHPLRPVRRMGVRALSGMSRTFKSAYSSVRHPGIPPDTLPGALLLPCLYTIRSERDLCRRLRTDLLFRWFLDLQPSDEVFDHSAFSHNRERLAEHGITGKFFDSVVRPAIEAGLTSGEHFTVDGSLIQSHASSKSLKSIERESRDDDGTPPPGARYPLVDFKGERHGNATHQSTTAPEARRYKKGEGEGGFLIGLRARWIEPHVAIRGGRIDPLRDDGAWTRSPVRTEQRASGYRKSRRRRRLVEEFSSLVMTVAGMRRARHMGREKIRRCFELAAAAYNLVRMRNLMGRGPRDPGWHHRHAFHELHPSTSDPCRFTVVHRPARDVRGVRRSFQVMRSQGAAGFASWRPDGSDRGFRGGRRPDEEKASVPSRRLR